eukprot:TRINITY_DN17741_c0_g2_i1.p1 TRINITY_DN17741_c0_g2~~TRINITY_DN17741_c0_g2_i1.p1  ORF type:complete len:1000 (-),score=137.92 TRINITY_DN17741_c0_g2_i1:120-3119(-)
MTVAVLCVSSKFVAIVLAGLFIPLWCQSHSSATTGRPSQDDCDARVFFGNSRPGIRGVAGAAGITCAGHLEDDSCCETLPFQQVVAELHASIAHYKNQIAAFGQFVSDLENTFAKWKSREADVECVLLAEKIVGPRVEALTKLPAYAQEGMAHVEHVVLSGICSYCFPTDPSAEFELSSMDGSAARKIIYIGTLMEAIQMDLLASTEATVASDPTKKCLPAIVTNLLDGVVVGHPHSTHDLINQADMSFDNPVGETMSAAMEVLSWQRRWPQDRRLRNKRLRKEALTHFKDDFLEIAARLNGFLFGPSGRLLHQLQGITLSLDLDGRSSLGRLFYGMSSVTTQSTVESELWEPLASGNAFADDISVKDPGVAFGLVLLISNKTSKTAVASLQGLASGARAMYFEDACGTALEALGNNCHDGGPGQKACLHPVHASHISLESRSSTDNPLVVWRRHASTQSVAHSIWAVASSYWGAQSTVWIADLRPDSCKEADVAAGKGLADVIPLVPGANMKLVRAAEELFGLDSALFDFKPLPESLAGGPSREETPSQSTTKLADHLAGYAIFHRKGLDALKVAHSGGKRSKQSVLVYSCESFRQCGGLGDRINGMVTAFLLAVLSKRLFLIDSENPLPLQMLLEPNAIDWRVRGSLGALAGLRHHSYHDKRVQFEADVDRLVNYPDEVLVVSTNYRMLRTLFESAELAPLAAELGLPLHAPSFLVADLFEYLFRPSAPLLAELGLLRASLGGVEDRRFIAIHFRTGDISWDPMRHGKEELQAFLACAKQAEDDLRFRLLSPKVAADVVVVNASNASSHEVDHKFDLIGLGRCPGGSGVKEGKYTAQECAKHCIEEPRCAAFSLQEDHTMQCELVFHECNTSLLMNRYPWYSYRLKQVDESTSVVLPWILATDSDDVARAAATLPEALEGKLLIPGSTGRIHIDRSPMLDVYDGVALNYAEWLLFGRAAAVVLSRSYFGETAAEIGRVSHAYFAPGGGCVRTDLSSS